MNYHDCFLMSPYYFRTFLVHVMSGSYEIIVLLESGLVLSLASESQSTPLNSTPYA
jgi:hypothetical protein